MYNWRNDLDTKRTMPYHDIVLILILIHFRSIEYHTRFCFDTGLIKF